MLNIVDKEAMANVVQEIDGRYGILGGIRQLKKMLQEIETGEAYSPENATRLSIAEAAKALRETMDDLGELMKKLNEVIQKYRERLMMSYELVSIGAPWALKLLIERLPTLSDPSLVKATQMLLEKLEGMVLAIGEAEEDFKQVQLEAWEVISKKIHERNRRILDKLYRAGDSSGDRGAIQERSDGAVKRSGIIDFRRFVDHKQTRDQAAPDTERSSDETPGGDRGDAERGVADQDHHIEGETGGDLDLDSGLDLHPRSMSEQHDGNGDS